MAFGLRVSSPANQDRALANTAKGDVVRQVRVFRATLAAASGLALLWMLALASPTAAQDEDGPTVCRVGLYLRALHAFDPTTDTFGADFWLWSVCPSGDSQPLQTMEFVSADNTSVLLDVPGHPLWANRNVDGTFRYEWDERNYPFDRHTLTIELEEGVEDVRGFVYEPDIANSGVDPDLQLPGGWRMTGSRLEVSTKAYDTTFGDPSLAEGGGSAFSRLVFSIDIVRSDLSGFFKLTAVVYAAFIFSLMTYLMHTETTTGISQRIGLLAIAFFSTSVNLINASDDLGTASGLTLIDKIHVLVLVALLIAVVVTVISRRLVEQGWDTARVAQLNLRIGAIVAIAFITLNAVMISVAMRGG